MNKKAEKIIDSTIRLFVREGIKKVTMDEIAQYANVSKVTIYKYFTEKEILYHEIAKYIFLKYTTKLEQIINSDENLIKKMYDFLAVISDFSNSGEFYLCQELAKYNNIIESEYEKYKQTYKALLLLLIDQGMSDGLIKSSLSRELVFHFIDMGVVYYQRDTEYHNKMLHDHIFRQQYMVFLVDTIFIDGVSILSSNAGK